MFEYILMLVPLNRYFQITPRYLQCVFFEYVVSIKNISCVLGFLIIVFTIFSFPLFWFSFSGTPTLGILYLVCLCVLVWAYVPIWTDFLNFLISSWILSAHFWVFLICIYVLSGLVCFLRPVCFVIVTVFILFFFVWTLILARFHVL